MELGYLTSINMSSAVKGPIILRSAIMQISTGGGGNIPSSISGHIFPVQILHKTTLYYMYQYHATLQNQNKQSQNVRELDSPGKHYYGPSINDVRQNFWVFWSPSAPYLHAKLHAGHKNTQFEHKLMEIRLTFVSTENI